MELAIVILQLFALFILIGIITYFTIDYLKHKEDINSGLYDANANISNLKTSLSNTSNILEEEKIMNDMQFNNLDSSLKDYFTFNSSPDNSKLFNDNKSSSDKYLALNTRLVTGSGIQINTDKNAKGTNNLRICDDQDHCVSLNISSDGFNITPNKLSNMIIKSEDNNKTIAKFDMKNNGIYIGGSDTKSPLYIQNNDVYIKNKNFNTMYSEINSKLTNIKTDINHFSEVMQPKVDNLYYITSNFEYDQLKNKPILFDGNYHSLINKPNFNGDYNSLTNKPVLFDGRYSSLTELPILFDGRYSSLTEKPNLFDGKYSSLTEKPDLFNGDYNSLTNKPVPFNGDYNSLNNKPSLFNGDYNSLTNKPTFDGNYNSLTNRPVLFDGNYDSLNNKPTLFDGNFNKLTNKPNLFSGDYNSLTNKPRLFDGSYNSLTDKPTFSPPTAPPTAAPTDTALVVTGMLYQFGSVGVLRSRPQIWFYGHGSTNTNVRIKGSSVVMRISNSSYFAPDIYVEFANKFTGNVQLEANIVGTTTWSVVSEKNINNENSVMFGGVGIGS